MTRGKYVPPADGLNVEFFTASADGRLHLQRCSDCERYRHPPVIRCPSCHSASWEWAPSAGTGRLFSWTVSYRAYDTAWADDAPWITAIVELDEGPRVIGWLADVEPDALRLDSSIVVEPEQVNEDFTFLRMRPA